MTPEELDFGDSNYADDSIKVIAKLKEEITQANHRYADLQAICDDQYKEIKRLEDALVEERARRICHQPREDKVGHWPRYEDLVVEEARKQLRAEGAIR